MTAEEAFADTQKSLTAFDGFITIAFNTRDIDEDTRAIEDFAIFGWNINPNEIHILLKAILSLQDSIDLLHKANEIIEN